MTDQIISTEDYMVIRTQLEMEERALPRKLGDDDDDEGDRDEFRVKVPKVSPSETDSEIELLL